MNVFRIAEAETGLTREEIDNALLTSLTGRHPRRVLILPPDFTRFHSNAGFVANTYYHILQDMGAQVDILPSPMNRPWVRMLPPGAVVTVRAKRMGRLFRKCSMP